MKILVIGGSPKGENSCTLQTALYLQKKYPAHSFEFLHAGATVNALEKDFTPAAEMLERADLLLFVYPVYTFIAPSQLHRFIAALKRAGLRLEGKFATQLTTSKHFYDITAHRYIEENCHDLGLKVIHGLSADMEDLLTEKGQRDAENFFEYVECCVREDLYEPAPLLPPAPALLPAAPAPDVPRDMPGDVVLVADLAPDDELLRGMIRRFQAVLPMKSRLVNIHDFPFRGGCISCFHCAADGDCIYRDGFQQLLRNEIQTADAIVLCFTLQDHSMGTIFKTYDDRQFCNGHRTVTMGKPFGYLVNGALSRESNLRMIMDGRAQVGGNFLAGIATDESDPDRQIDLLARRLTYAVEHHYTQPADFLGVGGMKIFRDLIWQMQGLMKADHRFFKSHGQYDFPQKHRGTMLKMYLVGALFTNPRIRAKAGGKITDGMLAPYRKVLNKIDK